VRVKMRLIKFEADWCSKCKAVDLVLETMTLPFPIERVDVDLQPHLTIEWGIRGIPHMILLDEHNNIVSRIGGVLSKQQLEEALGQT
jgi:thioredoxin 1